jgi:hypothetical protein
MSDSEVLCQIGLCESAEFLYIGMGVAFLNNKKGTDLVVPFT